jgi:hypothetical protein
MERYKKKSESGAASNQDESVLEKFLQRDPDPKRAIIMALDMLFAGVDTVILISIRITDSCYNFCFRTDFACAYKRSTSFVGKSRQAGTFVQRNEAVFAAARHSHHLRDAQRDEVFEGLHQGVNEVIYRRNIIV